MSASTNPRSRTPVTVPFEPKARTARVARPASWDAYSVWQDRVKPGDEAPAMRAAGGWDPYEVWRTRVKRPA